MEIRCLYCTYSLDRVIRSTNCRCYKNCKEQLNKVMEKTKGKLHTLRMEIKEKCQSNN